jgi:hypothetical protein
VIRRIVVESVRPEASSGGQKAGATRCTWERRAVVAHKGRCRCALRCELSAGVVGEKTAGGLDGQRSAASWRDEEWPRSRQRPSSGSTAHRSPDAQACRRKTTAGRGWAEEARRKGC